MDWNLDSPLTPLTPNADTISMKIKEKIEQTTELRRKFWNKLIWMKIKEKINKLQKSGKFWFVRKDADNTVSMKYSFGDSIGVIIRFVGPIFDGTGCSGYKYIAAISGIHGIGIMPITMDSIDANW